MEQDKPANSPELSAYNYCILFLDILGQREAFKNQAWLRPTATDDERSAFQAKLKETVGRVMKVQRRVGIMLDGVLREDHESAFRKQLAPDQQRIWDEMQKTRITTQHWSDGVVSYVNLGDSEVKCPMNGIFELFGLAGAECLQGLGLRQPIRGAIDGGWGIEIKPGELYGPAVAHAYALESEVAQYPRIVVGERVGQLLQAHIANNERSFYADFNRSLADLCLKMLIRDVDGVLT